MLSVVVSKNYKKYRAVSIAIFEKLQATSDQDLQNEFRGYPGLLSLLFQSKDDYRDFLRNSEQIHKMATTIAGS
jgi:hypothetical protein